jgi:Protein of unknown function (DUF1501)
LLNVTLCWILSSCLSLSSFGLPIKNVPEGLAVVRSMSTGEADHARGSYLMQTGYHQVPSTYHPHIGSMLDRLEQRFHQEQHGAQIVADHRDTYAAALRLMHTDKLRAFTALGGARPAGAQFRRQRWAARGRNRRQWRRR